MTLIRQGPRGGEYILRNGRRVYLTSMTSRQKRELLTARSTKRTKRRSTSTRRRQLKCRPGKNKKFAKLVNGKCVRFGDPNMTIKKQNPKRKKSFCARHQCHTKRDPTKPGYQSCKKWNCRTA